MNKKTLIVAILALALALSVKTFDAWAFGHGKAKGCCEGMENKFFSKAGIILKNQDELGLSNKQIKQIKDLEARVKKDLIRKKAEIDIISLDIKAAMQEELIDKAAVNSLIDKKYDLKKEKTKSLVEAYVAVRETLTDEQKGKLKGLWKKCKKEMKHGAMNKGKMKCPMM